MSYQKKNTPYNDEGVDMSGLCVPTRLKLLRQKHELRQSDVAEVLNMSTREYWRLEQHNYCTRYINLFYLAVFYNVTLDYLFGITNEQREIYDAEKYEGSFALQEGSFKIIMPNVEEYKKHKAEAEQ